VTQLLCSIVVAQSTQPGLSRRARPTVVGFFVGSLVTRWEAPGGFGASSGLWLANFSFSILMLLVDAIDL